MLNNYNNNNKDCSTTNTIVHDDDDGMEGQIKPNIDWKKLFIGPKI